MRPNVIFEDEHVLVVDKPAGLLTEELHKQFPGSTLVHRLDRETSGVLVLAKTEMAASRLKKQFRRREIKKTYRAFVYGRVPERGIIDKPIGSARGGLGPRSAKKPYGTLREATTVYRRLGARVDSAGEAARTARAGSAAQSAASRTSYVEVFPKTGRTHQIRVHFAAIGHPVVADKQYAPGRPPLLGFARTALHARSLSFVHPASKKEVTFTAPLPPDFVAAERAL